MIMKTQPRIRTLLLILISLLLISCSNDKKVEVPKLIRIATAANMEYAMDEIAKVYTSETGVKCDIILGSSGKLTAQIREGAPYDLFVSANLSYPKTLEQNKKTSSPIKVYAIGKLVLWTMNPYLNLDSLNSPKIKHIAIANTESAPYGVAAIEVLEKLPYFDKIKNKLVFGESISQTNQFITTQSAELGFTSLSSVLSYEGKEKGKWKLIAPDLYSPIEQGVVIIDTKNEYSKSFYDFLLSEKAKEILVKYGYETMN